MHRSITTSRPAVVAISTASGEITPNWSQSAFAPMLAASSAMAGAADGARNTSTTSTGNGIADRLGYDVSPRISEAVGLTGTTRYPRYWRYWPTKKLGRSRFGESPTIAMVRV